MRNERSKLRGINPQRFKILGVFAIASSLMGCIIVEPPQKVPTSATQTSSSGLDTQTVRVYYKVTDNTGANYSVNPSAVTLINLDSYQLAGATLGNPRAVVVVNNSVKSCTATVAGQGCFEVAIANTLGKATVSGAISFKLDGSPLSLAFSAAAFLKPPAPSSVALVTTEGVDNLNVKIYFSALDASDQTYVVNKSGLTDISIASVNLNDLSSITPRAVVVTPVTAAVSCDALNAGQGCILITLSNRSATTKNLAGTVSFKLDGVAFSLPFTYTYL